VQFFKLYTELLRSDNYVTRRQSLKLLGELLLDRSNVKIMMQVGGLAAGMRVFEECNVCVRVRRRSAASSGVWTASKLTQYNNIQ
jgi:hypothetical protein